MMKRYLILTCLLYMSYCLTAQNIEVSEQMKSINGNIYRSKQIKDYLVNKYFQNHIDDDLFLKKCRSKVLSYFHLSDYERDSLVFVEFCGMSSPGYTCSFYKSGDKKYNSLYINKGDLREEYPNANWSLTKYIVNEIRYGNLDCVLERGRKSELYPEEYIYIIIAARQDKVYNIKAYTIKYFTL